MMETMRVWIYGSVELMLLRINPEEQNILCDEEKQKNNAVAKTTNNRWKVFLKKR